MKKYKHGIALFMIGTILLTNAKMSSVFSDVRAAENDIEIEEVAEAKEVSGGASEADLSSENVETEEKKEDEADTSVLEDTSNEEDNSDVVQPSETEGDANETDEGTGSSEENYRDDEISGGNAEETSNTDIPTMSSDVMTINSEVRNLGISDGEKLYKIEAFEDDNNGNYVVHNREDWFVLEKKGYKIQINENNQEVSLKLRGDKVDDDYTYYEIESPVSIGKHLLQLKYIMKRI